jgi:hypothetical protein
MSLPQDTKPMFTGQLKRRLSTDDWRHFDLFLLDKSFWHSSQRNTQEFARTRQNWETQISFLRGRTKASLKWIFNRLGIRALLNRGLSFATGPKSEDPESEDSESEHPLLPFESAYVHNCAVNPFHGLPVELVLIIACYLSLVARLVMQRVCSKFQAGLAPRGIAPELGSGILTARKIFQFAFLLRQDAQLRLQDDYDREYDLAQPNSSLHRFGCSGCRTTHEIEYSSSEELRLSPKLRICKGLAASFRLCCHLSFSGQCLLGALRVMKNADYICQLGHALDIRGRFMVSLGGRRSGPCIEFHGGHTITIDKIVPILAIGENEEATHDLLTSALHKKCAYICPHLNSTSPELFGGRPMTAECPDHTFSEIRERKYKIPCQFSYNHHHLLRHGECVAWSQCPHPNCFTCYCLKRIWNGPHGIVLEVSRDLLGYPTHTAWLAQMKQKRAETKAEADMVNMPKCNAPIGITAANLQKSKINTQESKANEIKGGMYECNPRFKNCKWECVLARCRAFLDS